MKKITLDLDTLKVVSFHSQAEGPGPRGTVQGQQLTGALQCPTRLYGTSPCATCDAGSCYDTCGIPRTGPNACFAC